MGYVIQRNFYLRLATELDAPATYTLIKEDGENTLPRSMEEILQAIERRFAFVVEYKTAIMAVGLIHELSKGLIEMGTCIVKKTYRGLSIQKELLKARILRTTRYGKETTIFTAVKPSNKASLRNIRSSGFIQWIAPPDAVYEPCKSCPDKDNYAERCCCQFYKLIC